MKIPHLFQSTGHLKTLPCICVLLCTGWSTEILGQATATYTDPTAALENADDLYATGLFGQAFEAYDAMINRAPLPGEGEDANLRRQAAFGRAKSALRAGHPEGTRYMHDFITTTAPDPVSLDATMDLANFYYNNGQYEQAADEYSTLRSRDLDAATLSEARFKEGYCHFVRKQFGQAENAFVEVKEIKSPYYYPVNYYYGLCKFSEQDYTSALESFERVAQSDKYKDYVPYDITQIYFARKDYSAVIKYAEPKMQWQSLKNHDDMDLLLGRAYFKTGDYAAALPHLEASVGRSSSSTAGDRYQLAYTQYQTGDYSAAMTGFKSISAQDDSLGEYANFYIADCALKTGDLQSARTAFRNVSKLNYDTDLQEEALLDYGKLSAQLHYDAEAIHALDAIPPGSKWHPEAQQVLRDVFNSTRDYATTIAALNTFPALSPALQEAFQLIHLKYGMQLLADGRLEEADQSLSSAERYPIDPAVSAQGYFWRAEIAYRQSAYDHSADFIRQYFTLTKNGIDVPPEASPALAAYLQGYNYLHQNNYILAQTQFSDAVTRLKKNQDQSGEKYLHTILPDAMVRAADCAFKRNLYDDAERLYEDAIPLGGSPMVYARYQRAMIFGLQKNPEEKIRILENMAVDYPESDLADDVLLQLGITYQEMGRGEKATEPLRQLLEKYPHSELYVPCLLRLGLVNYNNGDISKALTYYKEVFRHQPTAAEGREALSAIEEIYVEDLKTPNAYFDFASGVPGYAVTASKRDSLSYRVGEIQYEQGDYASAVKSFTDYLSQFPNGINVIPALFYRGDASALLKQYPEALKDFEAVIRHGQNTYYMDALDKAATLSYNYAQEFSKALDYYKQLHAVVADPGKKMDAALGVIRSAFRAGNSAAVMLWFHEITEDPAASETNRGEAFFYAAKIALEAKDYDNALELFKQVTEHVDNIQAAEARFRIAQIYFFMHNLDEAEKQCAVASEHNGNYPYWVAKSLILISDIASERQDYFNARAPLEAVIENFQGDTTILAEAQAKLDTVKTLQQQQAARPDTSNINVDDQNH